MGVSLFTSRLILNALGETDFGIYNVVGGIVVMFTFKCCCCIMVLYVYANKKIKHTKEKIWEKTYYTDYTKSVSLKH